MEQHPSYDRLYQENVAFREEIARLKKQLHDLTPAEGIDAFTEAGNPIVQTELAPSRIHKYSSPDEKIELFMRLFSGRTDVYARRFVNKRTEKAGYAPVCGNEWVRGACEKPKIKCARCANRDLLPLTKQVIYRHLSGKDPHGEDVIGIYPMLPDETCRFLVADFDDSDWKEDLQAFREACKQHDIPLAVERSRSGNGGHAWFFFEEPVSCKTARLLGSGLLTAAMERRHDLKFSSYDRLLPNQDTMPSGGLGNLIALPLQGQARKSGNSEFVDEQFVAYPDQWAYLASAQTIPVQVVEALARKLGTGGELGILADAESTTAKPWERTPAPVPLTKEDFPTHVELVRANGVYLPKRGCSQLALGRVKRLAAFKNQDFYKAQAMRLSTYQKSRIICTAWETDEYIGVPRGVENGLRALLEDAGVPVTIQDKREPGRTIKVEFLGELREEQARAAKELLGCDNGVLSATTAFGKTVTAAYLIAGRKVNTLVIVHTQALMNQWKASLERFLQIDETLPEPPKGRGRKKEHSLIGRLGGGKNDLNGIIDIAIIGSLLDGGDAKPLVRDYGMVVVDECHHVPAARFETVLREVTARYVYGLSATPIRQDGHHPIIFQQCGPIRFRVDAREQSLTRGFYHTLISRFTRFRKPLSAPEDWPITDIYAALARSRSRNMLILHDVEQAIRQNRTPLLLTGRVDHAKMLAEELRKSHPDVQVFFLSGEGSAKAKRAILDELHQVPPEAPLAIVATGKYVGEGFDEPRLDTLFLAAPIAWKGTVSQYAGRLHRIHEGKRDVIVHDYVDIHVPVLERMYHKRLAAYSSMGYSAGASPAETDQRIGAIYNQNSFFSVLAGDVEQAQNEVLIVSPYLSKGRVNGMKQLFLAAMANGATIVVLTRPPESFAENAGQKIACLVTEMQASGIKVVLKARIHQKFAILDRRVVWYGSINLLSYGKSEESIMRFENAEIAEELLLDVEKAIP